jgi:probable HAF family extracellular repeat protein
MIGGEEPEEGRTMLRFMRAGALAAVLAVSALAGRDALGQAKYSVTNLGSFGLANTYATAVNDLGQVAGFSLFQPSYFHAFRTAPNSPINPRTDDLGTLGGLWSYAYGINNAGQVVGQSTSGSELELGFRTGPNLPINPATDHLGGPSVPHSYPFDVNNLGEVVGEYTAPGNINRGFRTAPNLAINPATDDVGNFRANAGQITVKAINDLGQVVGFERLADSSSPIGFRTGPHAKINPGTDNLGSLGGGNTLPMAINNLGQVVGQSTTSSGRAHAFRTVANRPINAATDDLGTLGGSATATGINDFGVVVGGSETSSQFPLAFVYLNGRMQDLNRLLDASGAGWQLSIATAINNRGQIVGQGAFGGETMSFLLTPLPEPASAAFAAFAGGWVLLRRRARA